MINSNLPLHTGMADGSIGNDTQSTTMIGVPLGIDQDGRRGMAVYGQGLRLLSRQYAILLPNPSDVIFELANQLKQIIFVNVK